MALFVDGNITSLQDLKAQETSILDLASNEGIDLGSKLTLAQQEMAIEIDDFLLMNCETGAGIENVVLTDSLRRWHCLWTLSLAFRDAYHNQLNDRYRSKFELYKELSEQAMRQVYTSGLGLVVQPIHSTDPDAPAVEQEPDYRVTINRRLFRG